MSNSTEGNSNDRRRKIQKRVAIFIGISRYDHLAPLNGAYNDINELTRLIIPAFEYVVTFTNDERDIHIHNQRRQNNRKVNNGEEIVDYLDNVEDRLFRDTDFQKEDDFLWIHFTGHGLHDEQQGWVLLFKADQHGGERNILLLILILSVGSSRNLRGGES